MRWRRKWVLALYRPYLNPAEGRTRSGLPLLCRLQQDIPGRTVTGHGVRESVRWQWWWLAKDIKHIQLPKMKFDTQRPCSCLKLYIMKLYVKQTSNPSVEWSARGNGEGNTWPHDRGMISTNGLVGWPGSHCQTAHESCKQSAQDTRTLPEIRLYKTNKHLKSILETTSDTKRIALVKAPECLV